MTDRVLLNEKREDLISGGYDSDDPTERNRKSRLKQSADVAFDELIEVARSPVIDSREVFEPDDVARLLRALLMPSPKHTSGGGLVFPNNDADIDDATVADIDDDYQRYMDRLYVVLDEPMHVYRDSRFPDPDE
jgi:hypothetical protein